MAFQYWSPLSLHLCPYIDMAPKANAKAMPVARPNAKAVAKAIAKAKAKARFAAVGDGSGELLQRERGRLNWSEAGFRSYLGSTRPDNAAAGPACSSVSRSG